MLIFRIKVYFGLNTTYKIQILTANIAKAIYGKFNSKLLGLKPSQTIEEGCLWNETTLLECLDGFLAIIGSDGIILYISESVSIYLGLTQVIFSLIHITDFFQLIIIKFFGDLCLSIISRDIKKISVA